MANRAWLVLATCLFYAVLQAQAYRYIGCFVDNGRRDLPVLAGTGGMYAGKCDQLCRNRNYRFFGLQYANECWCGNSYGRYGKRWNRECRMRCSGSRGTFCGAGWRNSVYATTQRSRTPGMRFLGCFVDNGRRDLPVLAGTGAMRASKCYRLCRARRYPYFGVQYSNECWCGNSYGRYGKRSNGECRMRCTGNRAAFCGASWRNSVYTTGLPVRRAPKTKLPLSHCSQHSTTWGGPCSRAIDGNTDQRYFHNSCTHTNTARGAWWQAKTSRRARITSVTIHNRQDCCANRLNDFVIKVDGRVCASYRSSRAFSVRSFACNAEGRTVRIETRNLVPLTLCEVQVFGHYVAERPRPAAPGLRKIGCFLDKPSRDLPVLAASGSMNVQKCYNLCRARRFVYFGVQFSKECWCGNSYGKYSSRPARECNMRCTGDRSAFCGSSWRNNVYTTGLPVSRAPKTKLPLSHCSQHSTTWGGPCSRAIDGNTDQRYFHNSCTHTNTARGAWWQAKTSRRARITSVTIHNRQDCCANRLNDFVIKVDGRVCASYRSSRAFSVRSFACNAEGRTVRIETRNLVPLTLCEVQVFGHYVAERPRPAAPGLRKIGCFLDKPSRDLPVLAASGSMNVQKCYNLCRARRFVYFGVQFSKECWCGNSYGKYSSRPARECNMRCTGDRSAFCGSSWRNNVYTTGLPVSRAPKTKLPLSHCSQHSTTWGGPCSRAIDGNTDQRYFHNSCTHTNTARGAWWQAKTSRRARITSVTIHNRQDCCANRLNDFVIKVDGRVCASYRSSRAFSVRSFACNAEGRTVRIETRNLVPLTLCEVQVFGHYVAERPRPAACPAGTRVKRISRRTCSCTPAPEERSLGSLVFVIDVTGSMGSVINAVRNNIRKILTANRRFNNYVVATFGDPYVRHLKKTRDARQVIYFLNRLRATGGGDCPEMAMSGALDAAAAADHNSVMMLFTDASAKDAHLSSRVASRLRSKSIRFYAVASGSLCGRGSGQYDALARGSGGYVATLRSGHFNKLMEFVKRAANGRMSFSAFPPNAAALESALRGRCRCRTINRRFCVAVRKTPGLRKIGCFVDAASRDLPLLAGSGSMSVYKCYKLCRAKRYMYFGVQFSKECWCGNSYGKYSSRPARECNMRCTGDRSAFCGSSWRNNVYTTGLPVKVIRTPGMRLVGCFIDRASRDLPVLAGRGSMSVPKCYTLCRGKRYAYFGVQNSNECWCGNRYGRYGSRANRECNMRCTGDRSAFCGAGWRNKVFTTGLKVPKIPTPGMRKIGCFVDNRIRDLPEQLGSGVMSVPRCYQLCRRGRYAYFGVQNARECWCGNSYGRYGSKPESQCRQKCTGDSKAFCGGGWRNLVYSTGLRTAPEMPGIRHLGCFVDSGSRDLPANLGSGHMSVPKCYKLCRGKNYMYFGVQNGNECWCGNSYGRYGVRQITECQMRCSGDKSTYCGAGWRNNIYATGVTPPAIPTPGMRALGCYVDKGRRDLPVLAGRGSNMRVARCYQMCRARKYLYFGVQNSNECWCGNTYGRYGVRPKKECRMRCRGDGSTYCGSAWRNDIFATGLTIGDIMPGLLYVGCFLDSSNRDLPTLAGRGSMRIQKCYQLCRQKNMAYFGLQNGNECWCGNEYGKHGGRRASECSARCSGDSKQKCGAAWRNNVYATGLGKRGEVKLSLSQCSQKSTVWKAPCIRAIDGNTNQHFFKHSCTHTAAAKGAWWQAKTARLARITEVTIYNRQDCCANRLNNFVVKVDGQECASYHSSAAFSVRTFSCNLIGRVVRIETRNRAPLTLCEVQAFGHYVTARAWPPAAGVRYLGCYIDNGRRDLPTLLAARSKTTRNYCFKYCKSRGYLYFGVQNGDHCTCGNSYGQFGRVSEINCRSFCQGEKSTYCGGPWRNAVYTTGLSAPRVATPGMAKLGCFVDQKSRDLPLLAGRGSMSTAKCYHLCRQKKQRFFGVQNGDECWCGNHYGRYGSRSRIECRKQCTGDKTGYCGAGWRNMIYTTGLDLANAQVGVRRLGCFVDAARRDLPLLFAAGYRTTKTFCWHYCRDRGYKYFGLQFGNHCTCGNTFGRYGRGTAATCSSVCRGDRRAKCGGAWRNEVFTTGLISKKSKTPGMVHLGCFVDARVRDLPKLGGTGDMTVGKCYGLCRKLGFRFFGVQYANECWCGNHYGRYGRHDKSECRMQCSGDKTAYCGAGWRNDIFTTGLQAKIKGSVYLGCFIDNAVRDLPRVVHVGPKATRPYCIKLCKRAGYKFAGMQYSTSCTCGNRYGSFGRVSDKQCNMACAGDRREKCGSGWRNSIFSTGLQTKRASTPGLKYIGCYVDTATRDLTHLAGTTNMSVPKCYQLCRKLNYRFFGVQYSTHCFCGNHYGRYGIRPNTECRMQCSGDKTTYCGAGWRNSVYTTGIEIASRARGVQRLGCFVDNAKRDLPVLYRAGFKTSKAFCWRYCKSKGYTYFGLQNGDHCTCGNSYGAFGRASEKSCKSACQGDKTSKCGGPYRNEVFTTGIEIEKPRALGMKHIGCFADSHHRDLPKLAGTGKMSVLKCRMKCKRLGYRYFGVQYANECWCGNSYGKHGKRSQAECRMQCTGNGALYCGASWRNDIFTTGIELEASTCALGTKEKFVLHRTCSCKPPKDHRGLGSLVFVIDTTGSMGKVIQSVKNNIRRIIAANNRFDDFVIATFGDPYKKLLKKTTSVSEITSFLNKLKASGGGDCPEFAMSGALDAAEAAEPNSIIILFTDASAKDERKMNAVAAKLKAKRIRFFTVATGRMCGSKGGAFAKLAKLTFGRLSRLHSKTSNKIMEFIRRSAHGDMSFSAFPANIAGLDNVLKGKCPCRTVTRRICVRPHPGFLGCYLDDPSYPELAVAKVSNGMTVWQCNNLCKAKKLPYFGLKNGRICGCGDQYGNSGDTSNANCNVACTGNAGERCGGSVYNGIFEVK